MIAGILNWTKQSETPIHYLRMQRETGTFPRGEWTHCQLPGVTMAASAREGTDASALRADTSRSLIAAFDGVLFNQDEMIQSLGVAKQEFGIDLSAGTSSSDADLLLGGYRRWGRDVLDHLNGDFAFAIWDGKADALFAAVDPFGLRPFYFAVGNDRLAFGSRMSQLRLLPWVGSDLNERTIVSFLLDNFQDPLATFYGNVQQIPGGHALWADGHRVTISRYWQPGVQNVCRVTQPTEVIHEFAERFRRAVRRRLDRRQTTGILMSGGMDSTALAGMTADIYRREPTIVPPIFVISALFGDLPCDESNYIDAALRRLPFPSRKIDGRNGTYTVDDLRTDMRRHEWPVLHRQGPLFNGFREAARSCEAQILLNGLGGDELTTDYRYYAAGMNGANPLGILRTACLVRQVERIPFGKAFYLLTREVCPEEIKRPYRWIRRRFRPDARPSWSVWLGPDYKKLAEELENAQETPFEDFSSATLNLAWRILTDARASWANRFLVDEFAAAGIQCRFPFLDRPLFDFVFSVPHHLRPRCRGRPWFKPYIAQGLSDYIPPEIRVRDAKVDFESYNYYVFERCLEFLRPCLFDGGRWKSEAFVPRRPAVALFQTVCQDLASQDKRGRETIKRIETLRNIAGLELWLRELER